MLPPPNCKIELAMLMLSLSFFLQIRMEPRRGTKRLTAFFDTGCHTHICATYGSTLLTFATARMRRECVLKFRSDSIVGAVR